MNFYIQSITSTLFAVEEKNLESELIMFPSNGGLWKMKLEFYQWLSFRMKMMGNEIVSHWQKMKISSVVEM